MTRAVVWAFYTLPLSLSLHASIASAQQPRRAPVQPKRSITYPFAAIAPQSGTRALPIASKRRTGPVLRPIPTGPRQITDAVDLSQEASRRTHGVVTAGPVRRDRAAVGNLDLPVAGILLTGGTGLSAALATPGAGVGATVQLTLATHPVDYGRKQAIRVRVDGRDLLSLTDFDPGGGVTRSLFLDFIASGPKAIVEVRADESTAVPITVSSIRCHAEISSAAIQRQLAAGPPRERMGVALLSPKGMGYTLDAETIRRLFRLLPSSPFLEEQVAVLYNYCVRDAAANRAEIDRLAALAGQTNVPLRIAFQTHWGGVPRGVPDGAGGTFTDLPYQQIAFDPDDAVDDPGLKTLMGDRYDVRFGLSVPNVWGDTPWLTNNHPRLNQLRRVRLTQALTAWHAARERLAVAGRASLLPGQLSTGDESIYWAEGVDDSKFALLNGGKPRTRLFADFNPFVVSDALRDAVNLDPRDGLDPRERGWLHANLARQQQRVVDWMFAALPADGVRLLPGGPVYGDDLARRNLFTEPYGMPLFPSKSAGPHHPGLELGFARNGRSGGQYWSGAQMLPWLLKSRERGRIALPNLECTGAPPPQILAALRAAYACGARFATLYNWDKGSETPRVVRAFASTIERPAVEEYLPAASGVKVERGKRWLRKHIAGPEAFGVNRVEVFGAEVDAATPFRLTLRGPDGTEMTVHGTLPPSSGRPLPSSVVLPTLFGQRPGQEYTLTLEIDPAATAGVSLSADGKFAVRLMSDIAFERGRSQAVSELQDAADLIESLEVMQAGAPQPPVAVRAREEAVALMKDLRPREAYLAGIRAEQVTLPSQFALPVPGGSLAPYAIKVQCSTAPVWATITAYDRHAATVRLRSEVAQVVTISRGSAVTKADLSPLVTAEITLGISAKRR